MNTKNLEVDKTMKAKGVPYDVFKRMSKIEPTEKDREEFQEMTKEVKYKRWQIKVKDLLEQLESRKDDCQDLWMMADSEFKGWQVKTKENRWYHSDMAMKEVYSHLDSAIFLFENTERRIEMGAIKEAIEKQKAEDLWKMLLPGLRVKTNGRVDTAWGDKTPLGLYRTIKEVLKND